PLYGCPGGDTRPQAGGGGPNMISVETKDRYLNRELLALAFNERVLDEGMQPSLPLLERLKFLGIVSSNLDEFFMVRMASLAPNDPTRRGACESARRL